jgi:hypothetical protein
VNLQETNRWYDRSIRDVYDTPNDPMAVAGRSIVWNVRRGPHLGQRSCAGAPTGRTYERKRSDQIIQKSSCRQGAVHIWVMGVNSAGSNELNSPAAYPPCRRTNAGRCLRILVRASWLHHVGSTRLRPPRQRSIQRQPVRASLSDQSRPAFARGECCD